MNKYITNLANSSYLSKNESIVTQSSSVIPYVPYYICILLKFINYKQFKNNSMIQISKLMYIIKNINNANTHISADTHELSINKENNLDNFYRDNGNMISLSKEIIIFKKLFYNLFGFRVYKVNYEKCLNHILNM